MARDNGWSECLEITDRVNIQRGLGTPFDCFEYSKNGYRHVDISLLIPPFNEDVEESQLFRYDHISIIINDVFKKEYRRLINPFFKINAPDMDKLVEKRRKYEILIPGIEDYEYKRKHRLVTYKNIKNYSILAEGLMGTELASIICYMNKESKRLGVYYYKSRINPPRNAGIKKLIGLCRDNEINVPEKDSRGYERFKERLSKKVYETVAWPWVGQGTKHEAVGGLAILSEFPYLVIDVMGRCGVYSRIEVPSNGKTTIMHKMIQPIEKFEDTPKEYRIGRKKKHVVYGIKYERNNKWGLNACWVYLKGDFFINPDKPSETEPANHIQKLESMVK